MSINGSQGDTQFIKIVGRTTRDSRHQRKGGFVLALLTDYNDYGVDEPNKEMV